GAVGGWVVIGVSPADLEVPEAAELRALRPDRRWDFPLLHGDPDVPAVADQIDEGSGSGSVRRRDGRQRRTRGDEGDQEWAGQTLHDLPGTSGSNCGVAAVDEQVAACHEGRGIAREIDGGAGDLLWQTEPTEQMLRPHHLARLVHVLPPPEHASCLDGARR